MRVILTGRANSIKKVFYILLLFLFTFIIYSCDDKPVAPEEPEPEPKPGRRDYTWEIDSLAPDMPYQYYFDLWGYTANEIWIVGIGYESNRKIARYKDGKVSYLNNPYAIAPYAVYGTSEKDIYFHNDYDKMWHFNGVVFDSEPTGESDKYKITTFYDIWSPDNNTLYGCGTRVNNAGEISGFITEYDGNEWNFTIPNLHNYQFNRIRKGRTGSKYYLKAYQTIEGQPDSSFFFTYQDRKLERISLKTIYEEDKFITIMGGILYLVEGKRMFEEKGDSFILFKDFNGTDVISPKIFGRNEQDYFLRTENGIGHENGTGIKTILNLEEDMVIVDGLVFEKDIFFLAGHRKDMQYVIIHGKID